MRVSGIIVAGGQSRRMGQNKALMAIGGKPVIERIRNVLEQCCSTVLVVSNDPDPYLFLGNTIIRDRFEGLGPLAGIHAGLSRQQSSLYVVSACDVPFLSREVVEMLVQEAVAHPDADAIIPSSGGRLHPLCAVYRSSAFPAIERALKEERLKLMDALGELQVLSPGEKAADRRGISREVWEQNFYNMNRPQEYEGAVRLSSEKKP
ncbi:molybdenum cofactor guanylyltransferase [Alteribacter natronophilus]|uniref:molybdenum cofactor guanylyltransferase n=1 Tax=Alteribacter natronophilus TaxID=2583810 RepID=UPI00110E77A8|nr:molybdenum cofactor guanylyltransferase [Alteribacter natronophilus]TMW71809.1 molybdenum cofactor guanylyltransferase [Alteribacter natronophilus]